MKEDVGVLKEDVAVRKEDVGVLKADWGCLKGESLHSKLLNRGISYVATFLNVRNCIRVRVAERDKDSAAFNRAIQDAEDEGLLTAQEYGRLLKPDMIVLGNRRGSAQDVYVPIKSSFDITNRDVQLVKGSEAALRKVFPEADVQPVLFFATDPPTEIRERCAAHKVQLIQADIG